MALTAIGRAALIAREAVKTRAYRDSVGVWTVGIGHAYGDPVVTPGMVITIPEAHAIFDRDLLKYEAAVDQGVKVPLADHERDALVSICFNIGIGTPNPKRGQKPGFLGSTFLKKLNADGRAACAQAIMAWTKPAEVTSRRTAERDQFLTDYATALPKARNTDRARVGAASSHKPLTDRAAPPTLVSDDEAQPEFAIRGVQERLIALGYHDVGLVDGKKGKKFASAVRQLQERAVALGERVAVDGVYGPQTRSLLDEKHGATYRNIVSPERANITASDLARKGTPGVVTGRRIQWASLLGALTSLAGAAYSAWQAPADLPFGSSVALAFLPPWAAAMAPFLFTFLPLAYTTLAGSGLVSTSVERVREGIDNSGAAPSHPGPGGLFGSLLGRAR